VLPEPEEPPEVPELPEPLVPPDPLVLPEPLVPPDPLVLPEPLVPLDPLELPDPEDPPEVPEPPEPLLLPEPLVPPDPLVPPAPPESVEPLVVEADDCPLLSPLPPPHAVIANATTATSNPLRTNDVFIMEQYSLGQHRRRARVCVHKVQPTCHSNHKWSRATDVPVANRRPSAPNTEI
jgi:hypothetical protein